MCEHGTSPAKSCRQCFFQFQDFSAERLKEEMKHRQLMITGISLALLSASPLGWVLNTFFLRAFFFAVELIFLPVLFYEWYKFREARTAYGLAVAREIHES